MNIVDVALWASGVGTLLSLVLIIDAWADHQVARAAADHTALEGLTVGRLVAEGIRFLAQSSFLTAALIVRFRVPGTFQMTVRVLLVAVPILLATSSVVSWWAKRRLLAEVQIEESTKGNADG